MKIGFIGLGRMGAGMAQRLLAANFKLAVFDPDVKQSARLAEAGAEVASSLAALASMCDVVISMLPSDRRTNRSRGSSSR
jgi:3-hydroxyisobutyrate dehydrogenase-like beta-hydroxyacid dehydrogenase